MTSEKLLFTPGPLTTSRTVKEAMLRDLGSRDGEFVEIVRSVRDRLLALGGVSQQSGWECVILQGSGTFGLEAVISTLVPDDARFLATVNGAYGSRIAGLARHHGISCEVLEVPEDRPVDAAALEEALAGAPGTTHVSVVHCETSTGMVHPVVELGRVADAHGVRLILDSMSAFGALPIDLEEARVDALVSSSNKCIEGVPGFSFVLTRRELLDRSAGRARTISLDLVAQWRGLESNGQFRFTPPTHSLLAFDRALQELQDEGGVRARGARYAENHRVLLDGMRSLGFREYLAEEHQGPIITSFHTPPDPAFVFEEFYGRLAERGFVVYPGKVTNADCFRIGTIGRLGTDDVRALLSAIGEVLTSMGVQRRS